MVADSSNVAWNLNGYAHVGPDTLGLVDRQLGFHDPTSPRGTPSIFVLSWYACSTPAAGLIGYCVRDEPPPTTTLMSWNRDRSAN